MFNLLTAESYVAIAVGTLTLLLALAKLYSNRVKGITDKTTKKLVEAQKVKTLEEKLMSVQGDIESLDTQVLNIMNSMNDGRVQFAELQRTVQMLHDVTKDLDSDIKEIVKILIDRA